MTVSIVHRWPVQQTTAFPISDGGWLQLDPGTLTTTIEFDRLDFGVDLSESLRRRVLIADDTGSVHVLATVVDMASLWRRCAQRGAFSEDAFRASGAGRADGTLQTLIEGVRIFEDSRENWTFACHRASGASVMQVREKLFSATLDIATFTTTRGGHSSGQFLAIVTPHVDLECLSGHAEWPSSGVALWMELDATELAWEFTQSVADEEGQQYGVRPMIPLVRVLTPTGRTDKPQENVFVVDFVSEDSPAEA